MARKRKSRVELKRDLNNLIFQFFSFSLPMWVRMWSYPYACNIWEEELLFYDLKHSFNMQLCIERSKQSSYFPFFWIIIFFVVVVVVYWEREGWLWAIYCLFLNSPQFSHNGDNFCSGTKRERERERKTKGKQKGKSIASNWWLNIILRRRSFVCSHVHIEKIENELSTHKKISQESWIFNLETIHVEDTRRNK